MKRLLIFIFAVFVINNLKAQVEVQADYNAVGDCLFSAYNNSPVPVYLQINFADLENTYFSEPLPYVKKISTGFNSLFTLPRDPNAGVPRFNYDIKMFRSDPVARVDLDFPYLIPFELGKKVKVFDVKQIDGFWGKEGLDSWTATGFYASPGEIVCAARNGIIAEIAGAVKNGDPKSWYHTWNNSITLLQPDGTLICYHNVTVDQGKFKIGDPVYAGQEIARVTNADKVIVLIFHDSLYAKNLLFVIPKFVIDENTTGILNSSTEYFVVHPKEVRGREMNKKEQRRFLGK
ncbi:M23 family metallopeptidase [Maribellus sp. YY47]|uniref:M23 family metallopeptidase n=1 Tax=Maribellus sp. YY47 TaxID=2929486 RepID=UPI0020015463|nr:M23 family metallopeptidase [Maribellus sp. YY47]MCK3684900.1 M23 family metallopeptidase [Maribellus sp. YY47]